MKILEKYYSQEDKCFHIIKQSTNFLLPNRDIMYNTFPEFAKACKNDFTNADLIDYAFTNEELKRYNLNNAKISSDTMKQLGIYNDTLFNSLIVTNQQKVMNSNLPIQTNDNHENIELSSLSIYSIKNFHYISDLHLDYKIAKEFKTQINEFELDRYLEKVVKSIENSIIRRGIVIFVGDITSNFELFKHFFRIYHEHLFAEETFIILGNHELWGMSKQENITVHEYIDKYREYINQLSGLMHVLNNDLYLSTTGKILCEKELLNYDNEKLRKIIYNNSYVVFGSIGFAGNNEKFNTNNGIYNNNIIDRNLEILLSKHVDTIHKKLTECISDKKIIFCTHMPLSDWSSDKYNPNWIYLNGHNHKNYFTRNSECCVYADNQIGYENNHFECKYFNELCIYNIFNDYADGIHEISRLKYRNFYRGMGIQMEFNRPFKKLYMIKKNGTYLFLMKAQNSDKLYLLNGGIIKNIENHDMQYFYNNLENYSKSISMFLEPYQQYQTQLATDIKSIGGIGRIHGCIIDIDWYNHLYVNPFDGKVTPYFAYDIVSKYIYKDLPSLLQENNESMYTKLLECGGLNSLIVYSPNKIKGKKVYVSDTEMYKYSNLITSFQYIKNYNIVRLWNDKIANSASAENGKIIIQNIDTSSR